MNRYVLGEDAELDLDDAWEYIARDSIEAQTDGSPNSTMLSRR